MNENKVNYCEHCIYKNCKARDILLPSGPLCMNSYKVYLRLSEFEKDSLITTQDLTLNHPDLTPIFHKFILEKGFDDYGKRICAINEVKREKYHIEPDILSDDGFVCETFSLKPHEFIYNGKDRIMITWEDYPLWKARSNKKLTKKEFLNMMKECSEILSDVMVLTTWM